MTDSASNVVRHLQQDNLPDGTTTGNVMALFNTDDGFQFGWSAADPVAADKFAKGARVNVNGTPKYNSGTLASPTWTAIT